MYLFTIMATPSRENSERAYAGGAYVLAWVNIENKAAAEHFARDEIQESNWVPGETTETVKVTRAGYHDDDANLAHYLEAVESGSQFVFHTWPIDAKDADVKNEKENA